MPDDCEFAAPDQLNLAELATTGMVDREAWPAEIAEIGRQIEERLIELQVTDIRESAKRRQNMIAPYTVTTCGYWVDQVKTEILRLLAELKPHADDFNRVEGGLVRSVRKYIGMVQREMNHV